ncbi:MAG: hypothetical protein HOE82_05780 [Gammaproteobacteria bacterium]|jgi:hypothetical protein|nr:hypothetical protein [Gammaproteobacteria bacterium]
MDLMSSSTIAAKGLSNTDNSKFANFNDNAEASDDTLWSSQKIMDSMSIIT